MSNYPLPPVGAVLLSMTKEDLDAARRYARAAQELAIEAYKAELKKQEPVAFMHRGVGFGWELSFYDAEIPPSDKKISLYAAPPNTYTREQVSKVAQAVAASRTQPWGEKSLDAIIDEVLK